MTERYNGWTNYETWCANLWIDQDGEYWREYTQDIVRQKDNDRGDSVYELSRVMKSFHEEFAPATAGMYADLLNASMSRINWHEIAEHYVDEVREDSADEVEE